MPKQVFRVISVQKGPLEGGGSYSSAWVEPTEWEDRGAPHLTRGPVPFKIDCDTSVVDKLSSAALPAMCDLDIGVKVAGGNKSKGYIFSADLIEQKTVSFASKKDVATA